jgi:hypothetical protein
MKLYYDNLFSFMPNAKIVDGKPIVDKQLDAARKAMIMLAQFQATENVAPLYEAVNQISIFAGVTITDLILSLNDIEVPQDKIDNLLDIEATRLFTWATTYDENAEVNPNFDYKYFAAVLLSIAHLGYAISEQERIANLMKQSNGELPEVSDTEKS